MRNSKLILLFLLIFSIKTVFAQNIVTYSNLSQTVTAAQGEEVSVKIMASCTGSSSIPVLINPTYCVFDNGLTSINFSNGTYLLPGQKSEITFKFKKTVPSNETFIYKFSTNSSCSQPDSQMIRIEVNYLKGNLPPAPPPCNLPIATGIKVEALPKSLSITWDKVPGAVSYSFSYRNEGVSGSTSIVTSDLICNSTTCTQYIYNLEPNNEYFWNFRAECKKNPEEYFSGNWAWGRIITPSCPTSPAVPTEIQAVSINPQQYMINFKPMFKMDKDYTYTMEYYDLTLNVPNSTKTQILYNPSKYSNFLNEIPTKHSFKFRIKANEACNVFSEWVTVLAPEYPSDTVGFPTNLSVVSACSYPGGVCGTGIFQWTPVTGAVLYEVQYWIFNYTSSYPRPISRTFQTALSSQSINNLFVDSNLGPWRINFYVRSKSQSGVWSDFSPSSAYFAW